MQPLARQVSASPGDHLPPSQRIAPQSIGVSLADVFRHPDESAERVTQALLNTPVAVVEDGDGWARVRLPDYEGWVRAEALAAAPRPTGRVAVVREPRAPASMHAATPAQLTLYASTVLPVVAGANPDGAIPVALPGGIRATLAPSDVELRPAGDPFPWRGAEAAVAFALRFLGTPYLWGGVTIDGTDCSGFAQLCWRTAGAHLPRDAAQQFDALPYLVARGELEQGDLIFFGRDGAITHVALSLGGERYVHAKGEPQSRVLVNSLDHASPDYDARVAALYMGARRVTQPATKGGR